MDDPVKQLPLFELPERFESKPDVIVTRRDAVGELAELLQSVGATVKIGLRAQGHLPTVNRMLVEGKTWDEIGAAIGWNGQAAAKWYREESLPLRVLVTGDRKWTDQSCIERHLLKLLDMDRGIELAHGACEGADLLADSVARALGVPDSRIHQYPVTKAEWRKVGLKAGPLRNRRMFDEFKPHIVLAFHNHIEKSRGTKDMVGYAKKHHCLIRLLTTND